MNNPNINPKFINPLKRMCMTIGQLPASYLETMSYYEMLVWFVEFLKNQIIPALNNNAEAVRELQQLYVDLKDYVDNYFENLDVQDEVNNKLDEMAESGQLTDIIAQYLGLAGMIAFDTVADMKLAENLVNGSKCRTLGFHSVNDGGGAFYKIRTITNEDIVNEASIIALYDDSLIAELIIENNTVNVLTFGVKGDGTTNDTTNLQKACDFAESNNFGILFPENNYLTDTITLNNIVNVKIEGTITLSASDKFLNVFENVNGETPKISINKVTTGSILMKGLNSANITIQNAYKLVLLADNTTGHNFIGYTTFNLGYIRDLSLEDDGSGTKWINENYFIGGRFLNLTIGGGDSTYNHQNNLFIKPKCENTTITISKGIGNRIIDARLEGTPSITFGSTTYGNIITSNYASTKNNYYIPSYYYRLQDYITDNSGGKNKVITNEYLEEHLVLSINKFNNPKELNVTGDNITVNGSTLMFESDYVSLPNVDCLLYLYSSSKNITWRIECYDETFTKLSTNPNLMIDATTISYISAGTYGNSVFTRNDYWGLLDSSKTDVKYLKIKLYCPSGQGLTNEPYKNIDMYLTHYGKLDNEGYYIKGFGTQASS